MRVAYLEGKAYHDNESLIEHLHNMENALIAKDINNIQKNRPNMSLKYTSEQGKMLGYILAYEGKTGDNNDEEVIYIADLAADPKTKTGGGRLIKGFIEMYQKHYLEKGKMTSILTRAREKTIYKIITKQIEKIAKELGINLKMEVIREEYIGEEKMYDILIRPENEE